MFHVFFFLFPRATHGTKDLSAEEILQHYGPRREWKHFQSLNTSFTRSGTLCVPPGATGGPGGRWPLTG